MRISLKKKDTFSFSLSWLFSLNIVPPHHISKCGTMLLEGAPSEDFLYEEFQEVIFFR